MWVAGADGCPAGWLAVFRSVDGQDHTAGIVKSLADVFTAPEQPKIVAVDIPIGLLSISQRGGRAADRACREVLGPHRQSSIFAPPCRPALNAASFLEACAIEQANSSPPKKLSQQTFNILAKIREADAIALRFAGAIFECHPEVSFWAMNARQPMRLPKKVSRRKNPDGISESGLSERRQLLLQNGYSDEFLATRVGVGSDCGPDDFVDACAAAWTAERILDGRGIRFPPTPDFDELGLDMAIWA
jgi:predicted RNase H-like nuclease